MPLNAAHLRAALLVPSRGASVPAVLLFFVDELPPPSFEGLPVFPGQLPRGLVIKSPRVNVRADPLPLFIAAITDASEQSQSPTYPIFCFFSLLGSSNFAAALFCCPDGSFGLCKTENHPHVAPDACVQALPFHLKDCAPYGQHRESWNSNVSTTQVRNFRKNIIAQRQLLTLEGPAVEFFAPPPTSPWWGPNLAKG